MTGDPADIRGWQRLDPATTTSGRLEEHDPARLAAIGVRHVINLALDDHPEALTDEAAKLAAQGIGYTHIPVPFDAPGEDHYAAFESALAAADGPVHVHCIMNWRVSAFFYRRNRAAGMGEDEASALLCQQWDPRASDDPRAAIWARFIAAEAD
ncbi:MAG: beta-lactamase hydrolase domain-containing protein [Novosphingobium sp.]